MANFKINRVYTRSGDDGRTGLVGGDRVSKSDLRVEVYGTIDELNSVLGIVKEKLDLQTQELSPIIENLQQELFDLGSELATQTEYTGMWHVEQRHIDRLEALCDKFGEGLPELTSFILPGGSELVAFIHLARTVTRRAERSLVLLSESEQVRPEILKYVNRLSDLFFNLARYTLKLQNKTAPLWVKELERV
jgi:cob(I)alamin adenosyltransferase